MAVVATMLAGPLVKIMMEKASGSLLDQYKVMKGMEEQHNILKRRLPAILGIITEAEQAAADPGQPAVRRAGVTTWLEDIKKVAYQANEVFDEFKYEALRRKAKKEGHYKDLGFNVVKLFPTHNRFVFRQRMGKRLRKVVRSVEVLVTEMNAFGFQNQQQQPIFYQERHTDHDLFDPKKIINRSRAEDNKNIVDILVSRANIADLTVFPIVGMGGLGKTTLAQLVYNDPEIQKHFDVLLWVCVSNSFDVDSLARSIVESAPKKKIGGTEATTASKTKKTALDILQNQFCGQRYLLVLDDVWTRDDDKWEQLEARLKHGGMGSVVLITTRDKVVAEIMGTIEAYSLGALGRQYIKEIIETKAFTRLKKEEERPVMLVNMVDEIVERCDGSPLVAIALGSILRSKTSEEEWKVVSKRSNICTEESGILPILKLSYNELPSDMKQCFAFCAIFPKDYEIDVDKLIQLWIAHGFIIQEEQVRFETIGKRIFDELASRSFFQDVKEVQATVHQIENRWVRYSKTTCKIHDLMHDVALAVMGKECALATEEPDKIIFGVRKEEPSQNEWLPNTARHLFLSCKKPERKLNSSLGNSSASIQTLVCDGYMESFLQHLSKYSSLQALQLWLYSSSFPLKPKHLHHLRYLDLSGSSIRALPGDMSILYNLQTLNLSSCTYLRGLPREMKYMTSLRHLYTHGCPELKSMPRDLGTLICLQTLTCFVAGSSSNCSNIRELGDLNLGGQLELHHLENVNVEDAEAANLVRKKELKELTLKWTVTRGEYDARVLEKLKPHDELHVIRIHSYGGTTFPTWKAMLQNIVEIHLFGCEKLQRLFNHDRDTSFVFPNLKELTLENLVCLERLWKIDNDGMQGGEIMFPLLEKLCIDGCEKLTALPGHATFPNLQNAVIKGCPELRTTAESPKLSVLNMEGCEAELFLWVARHMTSLTNLNLQSLGNSTEATLTEADHGLREVVDGKEKWSDRDFPLAVLVLTGFKSGVTELCACFIHLQDLSIWSSDALVHWPEKEFQGLVSLRKLQIYGCNNLTGYAQAPAELPTSSETRQLLPCLDFLTIQYCGNLVDVFNVPSSLRTMFIYACEKLESIFGRRVQQGQSCKNLTEYAQPHAEPSTSSETRQLLPRLESLTIKYCGSLVEVFIYGRTVEIWGCSKLESIYGRRVQALTIHQGSSSIPEVSSSSPRAGAEHLEDLTLRWCDGLKGVHLPPSLKEIVIQECNGLTSLGELPLLERLELWDCNTLSSLPDGLQAYSRLQRLCIRRCPGVKTLPTGLQQRLGSLQYAFIDARYYGYKPMLLKPKTWKYVCIE